MNEELNLVVNVDAGAINDCGCFNLGKKKITYIINIWQQARHEYLLFQAKKS